MSRRTFIVGASASVLLSSLSAIAQPASKIWRIGYLDGSSPSARTNLIDTFRDRLRELGYGPSDYVLDSRWAEGYDERLTSLAMELVRDKPDVILTVGPQPAFSAARATRTIPIVFVGVGDPVGTGLVTDLAHPPGNVTGITLLAIELAAKRLETLTQAVPGATRIGVLWNPDNPVNERELQQAREAAVQLGVTLIPAGFRNPEELDRAFDEVTTQRPNAVFVLSSPTTFLNRPRIANFAITHQLPMICALREYAISGCLISYGPSYADHFRRAAYFVDRILKGAKPSELPVEQPTKFELVINLKTAKAIGTTIPQRLVVRADEIIQ